MSKKVLITGATGDTGHAAVRDVPPVPTITDPRFAKEDEE
jgi:hypothetical protein